MIPCGYPNPGGRQETGKIKSAANANIFPLHELLGQDENDQAGSYQENSKYQRHTHMPPKPRVVPLFQAANVLDQAFDLVIGQFAVKFRHFAFAFFGDLDQIGIAFLGYFG